MSGRRRRVEKILQRPARMRFQEVEAILLDFGYELRRTQGSHCWFDQPGVGRFSIPKDDGRWVKRLYLDRICQILKLDELNLDDL